MRLPRLLSRAKTDIQMRPNSGFFSTFATMTLVLILFAAPEPALAACDFLIPNQNGAATKGPTFDRLDDGFTRGVLDCDGEIHRLLVMTIDIDTTQEYVGVRDDPLFSTDVTGDLKSVNNISVSGTSMVHVMGRVNQSPRIGVRRGFVHFATLCEEGNGIDPLNCSWGTSRIKFRSTTLDTDADEIVDRSFHELSIYNANGRLHMVTFWTPHRGEISNTTNDWIGALRAFGLDVTKAG